ncbi:MAG: chromosome segregation protein SMC [Bacteroidota bacterium]
MYLSHLEITGFKSFAQRVSLSFDSGISAIVGPNGCGKTNIVDAIRWVLGEQRYSALRSEKMEDVIFNGTKTRKPLGMAEAVLVIENTKGILPSEYTQVTVGRRVYRSGESEYLLNRMPCRLKDILDLFMDTGMGADAYSVIELKMIETILSDRTEERRRLFEEAAGVTKYKHRRKAAFRKLEGVQADLGRVHDIVAEVQKTVSTLERQARKAEQFNDVRGRLRAMEIDLMEREYARLAETIRPLEEQLRVVHRERAGIEETLAAGDARLDGLREQLAAVEGELAEVRREAAAAREKIQRVEEKNLVANERVSVLRDTIARHGEEKETLRLQLRELEGAKITLEARILALGVEEGDRLEQLTAAGTALQEAEQLLEARRSELRTLNERTIALLQALAEAERGQDQRKTRIAHARGRALRLEEERAAYEQEILRLSGEIEEHTERDRRLRKGFVESESSLYEAEDRKKRAKETAERLRQEELDVQAELDRCRARMEFLQGLMETREGQGEAARFLASAESGPGMPVRTVADAVHAEEPLRQAIEAALGDAAGLIIVDSPGEAERAVAALRGAGKGRAAFICLSLIPDVLPGPPVPDLKGAVGWAAERAQYEPADAPLLRFLLDRVLIVDSEETAARASELLPGVCCVTPQGAVRTGAGLLRGGSGGEEEWGGIGKEHRIRQLQEESGALVGRLEDLRAALANASAECESVDLRTHAEAVKRIEKEMNAVEMRIAQLQFEKGRAEQIIARNTEEIRLLADEGAELERELASAVPALESVAAQKAAVERSVGAATGDLDRLELEWTARSRAAQDLTVRLATLKGELHNARADLRRAHDATGVIVATIERRAEDVRRAEEEIALAESRRSENSSMLELLRASLAGVEERRQRVEVSVGATREQIHGVELRIRDERRRHDDSLKGAHELELRIADLAARSEHLRARAQEEFEHVLALRMFEDAETADLGVLRDEIARARERMKTLGNINFAAFEEYTAEKERYEFLSAQRKDLLEAEKTLLATIEEINTTAQRKFLETFGLIRANFIETFKGLFDPGDECDLRLEEGADPLEARIEIVAKPRGKRPTSIDLLSGGEKTLTAIALLFAIYLVKPSPFCILDEVDAPLDDANIDRFTRILRRFSDNTQFIVVTHNKRTMEAANALYGVTMEEEGVSKIVTVRFNKGAEIAGAALASG